MASPVPMPGPMPEPEPTTWSPPVVVVAGQLTGAVGCAVAALLAEPAGQVLAALAGLLLLGSGLRDLLLRPALQADAGGVSVVDGLRRRRWVWSEVEAVRVSAARGRGLAFRSLELDLGEHLVLLPRRRLGADVEDAAAALEALRVSR